MWTFRGRLLQIRLKKIWGVFRWSIGVGFGVVYDCLSDDILFRVSVCTHKSKVVVLQTNFKCNK
jgi:hypothetical protein